MNTTPRQERGISSRASVFLRCGFWGLLLGVAAVLPLIIVGSLVLLYGPVRSAPAAALGSAGLIALTGGAFGMIGGFLVGKFRTELSTAALPVGPVLLRAACWGVLAAAGGLGVFAYPFLWTAQRIGGLDALCMATAWATMLCGLGALMSLLMSLEDGGEKANHSDAPPDPMPLHPTTPPPAEGIRQPGKILDRPPHRPGDTP
jgi:hypothetical protein